ncbi:hypothetical protein NGM10_11950 [Halorussus salilacus]|uniref:hypothetical protein n=1 Tax=Halorussus salilacus TaxID=2953750 RepID=UPI0020A17A7C|nr:hypothetical protein [Halorussus salilacus]USZ67438.1 hypothetical protein NGM10_11950 [Halorussus salilacus]
MNESVPSEQELMRQKGIREGGWFSKGRLSSEYLTELTENFSFDGVSLCLVGIVFVTGISLIFGSLASLLSIGLQGALVITITLLTSVFTLLSVRESKRDREASVEPTLFVGKRGEKYGLLNLGSGPAHELSVAIAYNSRKDWKELESKRGSILRVDDFLSLETEERPEYVHMEYRSNVGYKEYNVTREVLPDED